MRAIPCILYKKMYELACTHTNAYITIISLQAHVFYFAFFLSFIGVFEVSILVCFVIVEMVKVLVTGGSGYVGSHCVCELLNHNYEVVVMDNLTNSVQLDNAKLPQSLIQVEKITGKKILKFFAGNVEDKDLLVDIFTEYKINVVMHFAALKSVSESVSNPLKYYYNNVFGSMTLLSVMQDFQVKKFIFSSSATVYGKLFQCLLSNGC